MKRASARRVGPRGALRSERERRERSGARERVERAPAGRVEEPPSVNESERERRERSGARASEASSAGGGAPALRSERNGAERRSASEWSERARGWGPGAK